MTEQELLNLFIQERVNLLLAAHRKTQPKKSPEEHEHIFAAECFIDNLPKADRESIQNYIEQFTDCIASEEPYLYQHGFMDAVRVLNYLKTL